MTRVIAGQAGGRRLEVPQGRTTRPTSDRAREALFSTWESLHGELRSARVLDLFAGSGAVGLEALSRGAAHVLLVESDARAARTARRNVRTVDLPGVDVRCAPVERTLVETTPSAPYGLVFADPPYAFAAERVTALLHALRHGGWLARDAVVTLERASRAAPPCWPAGFVEVRSRRYGEAALWYGRAADLPDVGFDVTNAGERGT